jgi:hypothetical protein
MSGRGGSRALTVGCAALTVPVLVSGALATCNIFGFIGACVVWLARGTEALAVRAVSGAETSECTGVFTIALLSTWG